MSAFNRRSAIADAWSQVKRARMVLQPAWPFAAANEALEIVDIAAGPTVSVPAAQATAENTALTLSSLDGNAISVGDSGSSSDTLQVALSVAHGTLALATTSGLTFTSGASGDASMTFTGTATNINAALASVVDTPTTSFEGDDTLNISVNDSATLAQSNGSATGSVAIAVGTRPSVSVPGVQGTDVGTPLEHGALVFLGERNCHFGGRPGRRQHHGHCCVGRGFWYTEFEWNFWTYV